ncbi:MAG: universal stress protein [Bacteroidia bacterium]
MKRILAPVNLRSDYENVLGYAASVAVKSSAVLTVFYAGGSRLLKNKNQRIFSSDLGSDTMIAEIRNESIASAAAKIWESLAARNIQFEFKFGESSSIYEIVRETQSNAYELVIMGTHASPGLRGYFRTAMASRLIEGVHTPVFIVPAKRGFDEIQHITYAVDLTDYDSNVISQVKGIAAMFDAKLTIVHVNSQEPAGGNEKYLHSLEKTISDTLDYPKVYYKFFDHADPLSGIKKFVNQNNINLLAMINRKKFSWRNLFSNPGFTREMTRDGSVPILAFHKH